jgi:hypothetical protein
MARKPLKQSIAKNCQEWGVGALNIGATRVGDEEIVFWKSKTKDWTWHNDGDTSQSKKEEARKSKAGGKVARVVEGIR